ncbi:MAG: type II CAAX endopeptidase family protein [Pseudomonadota bacterium]
MPQPVGLGAPTLALIVFALLFNSYVVKYLPDSGVLHVLLSPQIYFLVASAVIMAARRISPAELGFHARKLRRSIFLGLILAAGPAVLVLGLAGLLTLADRIYPFLPAPLFAGGASAVEIADSRLWILLVLAPLSEEIFFRGILLRALRENYSARWSVLLSAVIFMLGHGGFRPGPLMLGLINGPVALVTGSLIPCMIFHAVSNAYGPLLASWFPNLFHMISFLFR